MSDLSKSNLYSMLGTVLRRTTCAYMHIAHTCRGVLELLSLVTCELALSFEPESPEVGAFREGIRGEWGNGRERVNYHRASRLQSLGRVGE